MRLRKAGIRIETDFEVTHVSELGVWGKRISFNYGPNEAFLETDSIVLAMGYRPENSLAEELTGKVPVYNVGDSNTPSNVKDAIREGFLAGMSI